MPQPPLDLNRPTKRAYLTGFKELQDHVAAKQAKAQSSAESSSDINTEDSTPEDPIEAGVKLIKEQLVSDLLNQIKEMDPHDFEGFVLDLLAAMGYGSGSRQACKRCQGALTAASTRISSASTRSICRPSDMPTTWSPARRSRLSSVR